jgi:hypothetical protein
MTFIPKPKSSKVVRSTDSFKPIRPAFRERQYGSEFNQWELAILREFSSAKRLTNPTISGSVVFDSGLGKNHFLLIPAAHLSQDYVICECPPSIPVPANSSYVKITGKKSVFHDHWEIMVDDVSYEKPKRPIKPEIDFKEFQNQLFLQWGGIDSPLRELLAFEFVSSPPLSDLGQVGGLNFTLYDCTTTGKSKKLLKYFRAILPSDITTGKSERLALPELGTDQTLSPFSWRFRSFDADKPLNQRLTMFLDKRRSKRFSEISVGLGSKNKQPKTIYDPPLTKVDQPTILPDNAEMLPMHFDPPLEVTKYVITMQMTFPTIGKTQADLNRTLDFAGQKIVNLAEKYDLPQAVRRYGLFDPSYYGKPQSILRLALASARSQGKHTADNEWITKVFDEFYLKNMESTLETWEDIMTPKGVEMVTIKSEFDRQVLKYITEKESKETGVGFPILDEHFLDTIKLESSLDTLLNMGKIREVKLRVYRSVPFVE